MPIWAEQAIHTSMNRGGRGGYHVVSRSPGVSETDARALASWSPSHGALIVDDANQTSLNLYRLPDGRIALSRSCQGPPEYSGRGGRQVYTHALIVDISRLDARAFRPLALYRDALALGYLHYQPAPPPKLAAVPLTTPRQALNPTAQSLSHEPDSPDASEQEQLARIRAGQSLTIHHPGDRLAYASRLLSSLPPETLANLSLSTSLTPSPSRPFRLTLVP